MCKVDFSDVRNKTLPRKFILVINQINAQSFVLQ